MLATLVDAPFHRPGWVWEEKYDGIRLIAVKDGAHVRLITRNDKDRTADFPHVAAALAALPASTLVLDGEAVVFDAAGVSRFQLLQRRAEGASPPIYVAFDCLHARGRDLLREPLSARRAVLEQEVREGPRLRLARRLDDDGLRAFAEARRRGLEGVIGKDPHSRYEPGVRSPAWCKVKVRAEEEFVIGGFTAPRGSRSHLGALLVGAWDDRGLRYAGKVGTGFDGTTLSALHRRLAPLARPASPFIDAPRERDVTWLEPQVVAQLGFTEDKNPHDVRWPMPTTRDPQRATDEPKPQRANTAAPERRLRRRNPILGGGREERGASRATTVGRGARGGVAPSFKSRGAKPPSERGAKPPSEPKRRTSAAPSPTPADATPRRPARRARASRPRRRDPGP
jgi:bifunctional non-homologous end joining protein LigD